MATQLQIRRGTTAQMNAFTGAEGELAVNTTTDTVHVHDGSTAGGFALAKADGSNIGAYAGSFTTLTVDTDTLVVDATNNRVGIGTASPSYQLDLKQADTYAASFENPSDDSKLLLGEVSGDWRLAATYGSTGSFKPITFWTSDQKRLTIDSSGNVGIGIAPSKKLTVFGTGAGNATVQIEGEGGADPYINFLTNNAQHWSLGVDDSDADKFKLSEHSALGTNDYFVVDVTGNVGIGSAGASSYGKFLVDGTGNLINANASSGAATFQLYEAGAGRFGITTLNGSAGAKFTTAGTERMRIDSSGNVLVGKSSNAIATAGAKLGTGGSNFTRSGAEVVYFNRTTNDGAIATLAKDGTTVGSIGTYSGDFWIGQGNTGLLFNDGGDVLRPANASGGNRDGIYDLGASDSRFKDLYLSGGVYAGAYASFVQGGGGDLFITNNRASADLAVTSGRTLIFGANGSEKARIDSSGRVMVALTTLATDSNLSSAGASGRFAAAFNNAASSGAYGVGVASNTGEAMYFYHGGTFASLVGRVRTNSTTCFFENLSDQRLKENIEDADDAGSRIDAIQVRKFDWKVDGSHQDYGMIAQELQAVAPEAVSTALNPEDMMGVDYSKLVPMLVKEIQSLRSRVAELENN